ncbi:MAG: hypothetical protein Q8R57_15895 [Bacteroidota bacterium]|nr:hypothetical protein [Bacteroidota bacterium]
MEDKLASIKELLLKKSATKQLAYKSTYQVFNMLKVAAKEIAEKLSQEIDSASSRVEIKYYEKGDYEMHLKFSGDTLVLMMHTNIFDFPPGHFIHSNPYIQAEPMREFCGMIQIYNFLADSIKYNREGDLGYLVARVFVNKEQHLFIEGKRPLSFMFNDIGKCCINQESIHSILTEAIQYCLNFDLMAPPIEALSYISLEQKNMMSYSSGMPTGKLLGFRSQANQDQPD